VTTRHTTTGLLVTVALALAATACGPVTSAGPQRAAQSAPPVLTPKQRLQASLDKLTAASYDLTVRAGADRASGTVDPKGKAATIRLTTPIDADVTLEMDETVLAGKVLMRFDAGKANTALHFHRRGGCASTWASSSPASACRSTRRRPRTPSRCTACCRASPRSPRRTRPT